MLIVRLTVLNQTRRCCSALPEAHAGVSHMWVRLRAWIQHQIVNPLMS